jgi:hypothetical protein
MSALYLTTTSASDKLSNGSVRGDPSTEAVGKYQRMLDGLNQPVGHRGATRGTIWSKVSDFWRPCSCVTPFKCLSLTFIRWTLLHDHFGSPRGWGLARKIKFNHLIRHVFPSRFAKPERLFMRKRFVAFIATLPLWIETGACTSFR